MTLTDGATSVATAKVAAGGFQNGKRGLKAWSFSESRNAALEGPLFHGIVNGIAYQVENSGRGGRSEFRRCEKTSWKRRTSALNVEERPLKGRDSGLL